MTKTALVLLVEDDDDLRGLEAQLIAMAGYRVATAREGAEALQRVAQEMPAVIMLDMKMPGMDGWAFAREFRARHNHHAPIVVVTAAQDARKRAAEIAAEDVLEKPFDVETFIRTVETHAGAGASGARHAAPPV
ncbi:MAG: response regulator [Myxococcota bacterium]